MVECCYCKKTYSNEYTLRTHQTTTRVCIKIQQSQGVSNAKFYSCSICNKECTSKSNLDNHYETCKKTYIRIEKKFNTRFGKLIEEKEDELEQKDSDLRNQKDEYEFELRLKNEKIRDLEKLLKQQEARIEKISNKISKSNNNNSNSNNNSNNHITNNITINKFMSPERVEEYFKTHYNMETLLGGQKALARMVVDGFIKDKDTYHCTDRSRQKFIFVDENGNRIEDTDCQLVIQLTASGMPHVKDVYEESLFSDEANDAVVEKNLHVNYKSVSNLDAENTQFKSEMSKIVPSTQTKDQPKKAVIWRIMGAQADKNLKEFEERQAALAAQAAQ